MIHAILLVNFGKLLPAAGTTSPLISSAGNASLVLAADDTLRGVLWKLRLDFQPRAGEVGYPAKSWPHSALRQSARRRAAANTSPPGHSTVAVTMNIYSHVLPSMDRGAADKIDSVFAIDPAEKKQAK